MKVSLAFDGRGSGNSLSRILLLRGMSILAFLLLPVLLPRAEFGQTTSDVSALKKQVDALTNEQSKLHQEVEAIQILLAERQNLLPPSIACPFDTRMQLGGMK